MSHLSPEALTAWFEHGRAADRGPVIDHFAECDRCRQSLAALATAAAPETASPIVQVADALPRGYAARKPEPAAGHRLAWLRPAYALAAAAMVIVAVMWMTEPRSDVSYDAVRGGDLMALAPSGATSSLEFKWASPLAAPRYRVVIRDAAGALVYSGDTAGVSLVIDSANRSRFATMVDYSWTVSALDAAGEVIAESEPRGFLYQP
jgi:hypothetical protein